MYTTSKRRNIVALAPVVGETPHFWFVKLSVFFFFLTLHILLHPGHVMFENPQKKTHPECPVQHLCRWIASQAKQRSRNHNAALLGDMLEQLMREAMKKKTLQAVRFPKNDELGFHFVVIYIYICIIMYIIIYIYNPDQTRF